MNMLKKFYNNSLILNKIRHIITAAVIRKKIRSLRFDDSGFLRINLGCEGKAFYSYINIDEKRTKKRVFVSALAKLPFKSGSVKVIVLDYRSIKNRTEKGVKKIIKELSRVIVRAGILRIDGFEEGGEIETLLDENGFVRIARSYNKLYSVANFIFSPFSKVGEGRTELYYESRNGTIDIYGGRGERRNIFRIENLNPGIGTFSNIHIRRVLEFISPPEIEKFLVSIRDRMDEKAVLYVECLHEQVDNGARSVNFFDKANLMQIITELDFLVRKIELKDGLLYIEAQKKPMLFSMPREKKRVCAIGQYLMFRYNHLGFEWDSIPRALEHLDMDYLLIEGMRNKSIDEIGEAILSFRPDYILVILKETMPVVHNISAQLKEIGAKVIFWFMDPVYPKEEDLSGIVDFMFLSNRGQIGEYKKIYHLDNVFYMPQGIGAYTMHRRDYLKEIYDIGFTGAISKEPLHRTRSELMRRLRMRYNVKIRNDVRNNIAEFYSRSKIVFGVSDFDYELYTSNRFFVALGCGACYLTKKFDGIELLARNKEHILWFESEVELYDIVDFYLSHDKERNEIRQNAQRLAHDRHTCINRLRNMLDIVEGKTEEFYGFL